MTEQSIWGAVGGGRRRAAGLVAIAAGAWLAATAPRAAFAAEACFINTNSPAAGASVQGFLAGGAGCPAAESPHNIGYAGTFNIQIDNTPPSTLSYCVDIANPISPGQCNPQDDVGLPCEVVYILNHFYPHALPVLGTADEAAAVQAAIWFFTDCYHVTGPSNIATRANFIIAAATGQSCTPPEAPETVTITPANAINILPDDQHCATATVLDTQGDPVADGTPIVITITGVSGPQVINGTTTGGQFAFCYQNATAVAGLDTVTGTVSFTVPVGLSFKQAGRQGIVLAGEPRTGTADGSGTKNWIEARCGDGTVNQASEECDDGNQTNGDGCDNNCTETRCGNGIETQGEECDDGNASNGDACDDNCTVPRCGNGVVVPPEQCDDGNTTDGDGCDHNCRPTGCGNGVTTPPEQCDDGNTNDGDGCDNNCTTTVCGNGVQTDGEACDDGNLVDGDGCDHNCTPTACGNGVTTPPEQCDDGNVVSGDGCDANCTLPRCGNGITVAPEQCDDGNQTNGDGCDNNCTFPGCGNGVTTPPEQCDDGNTTNGDGCDSNCKPTACGNGIQTPPEQCDDGNLVSGDGCNANCGPDECGDGFVTSGEECDDGNTTSGDGCDSNCTTSRCGNGVQTPPEQCDDGNTVDGDTCEADCTVPRCGNGIVDPLTEQCDDGNTADGDGCSATCQLQEICTDLLDNDGDGLADCDDPDCDCQVFGKDPSSITFRQNQPGHDKFKAHGRMVLANPSAMFTSKFGVLLTNANGTIYRDVIDAGKLVQAGKGAKYANKAASKSGGLVKVKIVPKEGYVRIQLQTVGDLSRATVPLMGIQVLLAGEEAYYKAEWQRRANGWRLTLPANQ